MGVNAAIVPGSLSSVATAGHVSVAEAFVNADHICLVDVSGSMADEDSRDGLSRYAVACEELAKLQRELPGRVAVVAFSSSPVFCPGGVPGFIGGGTNLAAAMQFIRPADGLVDVWIVSDGEPSDEQACFDLAGQMSSKLNGVYVGPRGGAGRDFLARLCRMRGGQSAESAAAVNLAGTIKALMGTAQA